MVLPLLGMSAVGGVGCSSSPAEPVDASTRADATPRKVHVHPDAARGDAARGDAARRDARADATKVSDAAADRQVPDATGTDGPPDGPRPDAAADAGSPVDAELDARDATAEADAEASDGSATDASLDATLRDAPATDAPVDAGFDASGPPVLTALATAPVRMEPAFSPDVHDYYVRCAAGQNAIAVKSTASPGALAKVTRPFISGAAPEETVHVEAVPNDAIVVKAFRGTESTEYWIRCLPPDFPEFTPTPHLEAGTATPGYYAVGNAYIVTGAHGYAILADSRGTPVWYGITRDGTGAWDVQLLDSNTMAYIPDIGNTFGPSPAAFELHTFKPVGVTLVTTNGPPVNMHELRRVANGDYFLFSAPVLGGVDLSGIGGYGSNADILDCVVQEVSPDGGLVWQWTASDHLDPKQEFTFPTESPVRGTSPLNPDGGTRSLADPFHCNAIDFDPSGNVLISMRDTDAIVLVSYATGKILWKMGGTTYNLDGAPHITVTGDTLDGFFRQHDARFLPDGTISLFDDQTGRPGTARGLIVSYDADAGTASVVWQRSGESQAEAMGSFTLGADGSRVIGWGIRARNTPDLSEVTADGGDLFDFAFPKGDMTYRAIKYPLNAVDLDDVRNSIGPWSSQYTSPDAGVAAHDGGVVDGGGLDAAARDGATLDGATLDGARADGAG